jgi:hypothetical protein
MMEVVMLTEDHTDGYYNEKAETDCQVQAAPDDLVRTDNASRSFSRPRIAEVFHLPTDNASRR